jgi:hypothetical protein
MWWHCTEGEGDLPRKRQKSERGRGRPYAGRALYERVHWADWVEEAADEHRQRGSRKPYLEALIDLLEMTEEPEVVSEIIADERRFARVQKNFKKKRLKARKELRMMNELAEQINNYGRSLKRAEEKSEEDRWPAARQR